MWNLKNKLVNITEIKQNHSYRKQSSGYQCREGREEEQDKGRRLRSTNYYV